jgi:3D (Asp-Asp-Asp) domain-containing protein
MKNTVAEALAQNNISVKSYDYVSMPLDASLRRMKTNEINIKRAVKVYIYADGTSYPIMTCSDTVGELFKESAVRPNSLDKLDGVTYEDKIKNDMTVKIVRVNESVVTENQAVPFKTVKRENDRLDSGTERVLKTGKEGLREKQYKVVTEDGKVISKQLIKDYIALAPINMIMEFGTVLNHKTSRGDVLRYDKVLDMRATAYTASYSDTGKSPGDPGFGITYTGIRAKKGVIAVDPRVIPLGTRIYVEVAGSTPDYGYAVAADIGGAIKGNLIDLYVDSQQQANNWGVKRVKVYILLND